MIPWQTGVAEVVASNAHHVTVRCPHCGGTHQHGPAAVGSNSIVAGCHRGFARCREYRVIDLGAGRSRSRRVNAKTSAGKDVSQ